MIPADRRPPEKEETWTLPDQDSCVLFDDIINSKPTGTQDCEKKQLKLTTEATSVDTGDNVNNILPRSQETRKSKTKKVKSYLRKCKGALSKGDENVTEKKGQENCTSWYLEDIAIRASREDYDEPAEKYTEFSEERLEETRDTETVEDLMPETFFSRNENLEGAPDETFIGLLEENRRIDLGKSETLLYENAKRTSQEQHISNQKTPTRKPEKFCGEEKKDIVLLETLTAEETNLNKFASNDTLIAEVAEEAETAINFNSRLTVGEGENDLKTLTEGIDEDAVLAILTSCAVSLFTLFTLFVFAPRVRCGSIDACEFIPLVFSRATVKSRGNV